MKEPKNGNPDNGFQGGEPCLLAQQGLVECNEPCIDCEFGGVFLHPGQTMLKECKPVEACNQ